MNLKEKSLEVSRIFKELDAEIHQYISQSQLTCFSGCGLCCTNPKVTATVLEFLPLAFDFYQNGKAEDLLGQLENTPDDSFCIILKHLNTTEESGLCSSYSNRGLICRLFGSAARRNREGQKELITCKKIKEEKKEDYLRVSHSLKNGLAIPMSTDYYTQLYGIDFHMAEEHLPINLAIRKALEAVLSFYFYTEGQAV